MLERLTKLFKPSVSGFLPKEGQPFHRNKELHHLRNARVSRTLVLVDLSAYERITIRE